MYTRTEIRKKGKEYSTETNPIKVTPNAGANSMHLHSEFGIKSSCIKKLNVKK